jgi:hypothetical protein
VEAEHEPGTAHVLVDLPEGSHGNITTGKLAKAESRGTFSTFSTPDHSARLAELRELNKPAPRPPAPPVLVIQQNNTTVVEQAPRYRHGYDYRYDRRVHQRRQRRARQGLPTPVPSWGE